MEKENYNPNRKSPQRPIIDKYFYTQDCSTSGSLCKIHAIQIGQYFCQDCLVYNICQECLQQHYGHSILHFSNSTQAKEATRQTLLLEVESTLNRLKGRQNQLKNQVQEVTMIRDKVKCQAQSIVNVLRQQVDTLSAKISQKVDKELARYEQELQNFYRQYDSVNNHLREHLLSIIDGEIDITTFGRYCISKDIDSKAMPNFPKFKQVLEKSKQYLKKVESSVDILQKSIRYFSSEEEKTQASFDKYDRFLRQRTPQDADYNSPLLRTLNILENTHHDFNKFRMKLRN